MTTRKRWRPTASLDALRMRAVMLARARDFFAARNVLEVTTPTIDERTVTDVNIESIQCRLSVRPHQTFFLQTSPEYRMKQLLAAYRNDIYQIGTVYRDEELGRHHQPEFTMIEWYRQHLSLDDMIGETLELLGALAAAGNSKLPVTNTLTYVEVFQRATGLDPLSVSAARLCEYARDSLEISAKLIAELGNDQGAWLNFLFGAVVAPALERGALVIVRDYPAAQAALARLDPDDARTAQRFEIFWDRLEIANGYCELTDSAEQQARFEADRATRTRRGLAEISTDEKLIAALDEGLPDCCGVAVGFDRLVMRVGRLATLSDAVSFSLT